MNLFCNNQFYNKESLLPTTDTILCLIIAHTRGQIQHWSAIHHKEAFIKIYASLQTDRMLFRTQIGRDYNNVSIFSSLVYSSSCLWGVLSGLVFVGLGVLSRPLFVGQIEAN